MERETVPGYCLVSKPVNRSSVESAMRGALCHVTYAELAAMAAEPISRAVQSYAMRWPGKETGLPGPNRRQLVGQDESHTRRPPASDRHLRSGTAPPPRTPPLYGVCDQVETQIAPF